MQCRDCETCGASGIVKFVRGVVVLSVNLCTLWTSRAVKHAVVPHCSGCRHVMSVHGYRFPAPYVQQYGPVGPAHTASYWR